MVHVGAVVYYLQVKKDDLVKPMIIGVKEVSDPAHRAARGGGTVAFIVALAVTAAVLYFATGSFIEPPPPPPPAAWWWRPRLAPSLQGFRRAASPGRSIASRAPLRKTAKPPRWLRR